MRLEDAKEYIKTLEEDLSDTREELERAGKLLKIYEDMVDKLLNHCDRGECMECAKIVCPYKEPLHLHHDGCPCCSDFTRQQYHQKLLEERA